MQEFSTIMALNFWHRVMASHVRGDAPDLTSRQMAIFLEIYLNEPRPHTVRALAKTLQLSKPVITRALDRMEKLDFIRRKRDEADRRSVFIHRTVKGAGYLSEFADLIVTSRPTQTDATPVHPHDA